MFARIAAAAVVLIALGACSAPYVAPTSAASHATATTPPPTPVPAAHASSTPSAQPRPTAEATTGPHETAEPQATSQPKDATTPKDATKPKETTKPKDTAKPKETTKPAQDPQGVVTASGGSAVVGDGTPQSCTSAAVQKAIKGGGSVRFDCGPDKITITVTSTLYVCNTSNCKPSWQGGKTVKALTVDGGGKVTLSGGGKRGIFYANTCEEEFGWISDHCQNQKTPKITFTNIGFTKGNASKGPSGFDGVGGGGGGGAIAVRGAPLVISGAWFTSNTCMTSSSDGGGGAVRITGSVVGLTVTNSTFTSNSCANGGAVSSLHSPMTIKNTTFTKNSATGTGASSGKGGNGGAMYYDGAGGEDVTITGCTFTHNTAPEGGPGVFYVSNDESGTLTITNTTMTGNTGQSFYTEPYRSIFFKGKDLVVSGSTVN